MSPVELFQENVKYVSVIFTQAAKTMYTYKVPSNVSVEVDDFGVVCVLDSNGRETYKVIKVVAVDVQPDYTAEYKHKWLITVFKMEPYLAMLAAEQEAEQLIAKAEARVQWAKHKEQLTALLNTEEETKLLTLLNPKEG